MSEETGSAGDSEESRAPGPDALAARLTRLQLGGAALLLLISAGVLAVTIRSSGTAFLWFRGPASWVQAPVPVRRVPISIDASPIPQATFTKEFVLEVLPEGATLTLRAWRAVQVTVNGVAVAGGEWRVLDGGLLSLPIDGLLRRGTNRIGVRVTNRSGPPLLLAELSGADPPVATDATWEVRVGDREPTRAIQADDTRAPGELLGAVHPAEEARSHATVLFTLFALSAGAYQLCRRWLSTARLERLSIVVPLVISALWVLLFVGVQTRVPLWAGPDAARHVEHVQFIAEHRILPLADQGWAMYHPPAFYALSAIPLALFDPTPGGVAERSLLRLIPALATLGNVWIAWLLSRLLFPGRDRMALIATLFASAIPMNLFLSTYVSNESLHGFLANLALLTGTWVLLRRRYTPGALATLAALLGIAILSKVTSLLLVPVAVFFVGFQMAVVDARRPRAIAKAAGILLGGLALVCGWFFVRNWVHFGDWLVWNHAIPGGESFWQQPGFRTARYYLTCGDFTQHPFAATFRSFWGALYVTFWGDGTSGGGVSVATLRSWWNVELMSIIYLLALPATLLMVAGAAAALRTCLRGSDLPRRVAFTFLLSAVYVVGFALLQRSLAMPYYSFVKASFASGLVAPLAIGAALGVDSAHRLLERVATWAPAILYGWLGALVASVYLVAAG